MVIPWKKVGRQSLRASACGKIEIAFSDGSVRQILYLLFLDIIPVWLDIESDLISTHQSLAHPGL